MTNVGADLARASQLTLVPEHEVEPSGTPYRLLPSVWDGEDCDLLEMMLNFYPHVQPERILDATVNSRRFWRGSARRIIGLDINPRFGPDIVGDNQCLPIQEACLDVVVYDPPHIPNQGKDRSKDFNTRFGLILKSSAQQGYNLSHLYQSFAHEA